MNRRELIALLGTTAATWPINARAQQVSRTYRLGFLLPSGRQTVAMHAFFDELRLNGFIEGQNLAVISDGFAFNNERLGELAAAVISAGPDAIVAGPERPLRALQAASRTIPLVGMSEDMVAEGLVASLARPGGNITGISLLSPELDGKRQDILMAAAPHARRIAAVADAKVTPRHHLETLQSERVRAVLSASSSASMDRRKSYRPSIVRKRPAPKRLTFWPRRCSQFPVRTTIELSWTVLRRHACQRFSSGPTRREPAP